MCLNECHTHLTGMIIVRQDMVLEVESQSSLCPLFTACPCLVEIGLILALSGREPDGRGSVDRMQ